MDAATFRADFPQFADTAAFPDASVNFWLTLASRLYSESNAGEMFPYIQELFAAHNLSLMGKTVGSTSGAPVGMFSGIVSSKSVGGVSVSYDTSAGSSAGAGTLNLTIYGRQLWDYFRMLGAGGIQL